MKHNATKIYNLKNPEENLAQKKKIAERNEAQKKKIKKLQKEMKNRKNFKNCREKFRTETNAKNLEQIRNAKNSIAFFSNVKKMQHF